MVLSSYMHEGEVHTIAVRKLAWTGLYIVAIEFSGNDCSRGEFWSTVGHVCIGDVPEWQCACEGMNFSISVNMLWPQQ